MLDRFWIWWIIKHGRCPNRQKHEWKWTLTKEFPPAPVLYCKGCWASIIGGHKSNTFWETYDASENDNSAEFDGLC